MPNNKSLIVVFLVLAGALTALIWYALHRSKPLASIPESAQANLSPAIDIDIYVDGSGSMKNFLKTPGDGNTLQNFLEACEYTLRTPPTTGGWTAPHVRFWKFGAGVTLLPENGGLHDLAEYPDGIHSNGKSEPGFTEKKTSIEVPIKDQPQARLHSANPELKIIVTDLYQSDEDNEKPARALVDQYLTDAGAVAIYGIRNPYSGPVEDLPGLHGVSLPPGAADTMPFYIIIAGDNAADVYHAQEVLMTGNLTGPVLGKAFDQHRAFAMYFSKNPGWKYTSDMGKVNDSPQVESHDPNDPKKKLGLPQVAWRDAKDRKLGSGTVQQGFHDSIGLLTIRSGKPEVTFSLPQQVIERTGEETPVGADFEVRTAAYVTRSGGKNAPPTQQEDKSVEKAADAGPCKDDGNKICVTFDRERLHKNKGIYLFQFDVIATRSGDTVSPGSETMKQWSFIQDDIPKKDPQQFQFPRIPRVTGQHPGRTPNLSAFLTVLQERIFQVKDQAVDPVRVATYDLYVEAK